MSPTDRDKSNQLIQLQCKFLQNKLSYLGIRSMPWLLVLVVPEESNAASGVPLKRVLHALPTLCFKRRQRMLTCDNSNPTVLDPSSVYFHWPHSEGDGNGLKKPITCCFGHHVDVAARLLPFFHQDLRDGRLRSSLHAFQYYLHLPHLPERSLFKPSKLARIYDLKIEVKCQ